jgi:hypothetical protein
MACQRRKTLVIILSLIPLKPTTSVDNHILYREMTRPYTERT